MKQRIICKALTVAVILLLSISVTPSIGISNNDDTTPPVTTHSLNPIEPDGNNGWYVSDVNVTLIATDDLSGVNVTYFRIDEGEWLVYIEPFTLSEDGDNILIEYYSVDYAENVENVKSFMVDIDKTEPDFEWESEYLGEAPLKGRKVLIRVTAIDDTSGMNKVLFHVDRAFGAVVGPGPVYEWDFIYRIYFPIVGIIDERNITGENIEFFGTWIYVGWLKPFIALWDFSAYDNAGNYNYDEGHSHNYPLYEQGIYRAMNFKLSKPYIGIISNRFIIARFYI